MSQKAFVIHPKDNVGTAVDNIEPGIVSLIGVGFQDQKLQALEAVKFGFKIALFDFKEGEPILKNNAIIGLAKTAIKKGSMMHLHNIRSEFDERSGTFDNETGAPQEEDVYI